MHASLAAAVAIAFALAPVATPAEVGHPADHGHATPAGRPSVYDGRALLEITRSSLPPPPAGVTDLDFRDLFAPPGRRGLAYSEKARALDGRDVRILGYMIRQDLPADGLLLLAPYPFQLHEIEYGLAEDLPATVVHVRVPDRAGEKVPHSPGLLLLTGRLELGPREEPDGRVSSVRLHLHLPPAPRGAGAASPDATSPHVPRR